MVKQQLSRARSSLPRNHSASGNCSANHTGSMDVVSLEAPEESPDLNVRFCLQQPFFAVYHAANHFLWYSQAPTALVNEPCPHTLSTTIPSNPPHGQFRSAQSQRTGVLLRELQAGLGDCQSPVFSIASVVSMSMMATSATLIRSFVAWRRRCSYASVSFKSRRSATMRMAFSI